MSWFIENAKLKFNIISGTTSPTANTETAHAHGGNTTPKIYLIKNKKTGVIYESKPADATNIYLKSGTTSVTFDALIIWW